MATQLTQTTFLSQYNDDWRDSDHYHRILFNNGRALQARELTQIQTIIQAEISKIGGFLFSEGGMFDTSYGALSAGGNSVAFVKVTSLPTGYAALEGAVIENQVGVKATIKKVLPAEGSDPATLMLKYITSNNLTSVNTTTGPRIFLAGEKLDYNVSALGSGSIYIQTTDTSNNPATGKGAMIEVPQFNTFVAGHIIMVEAQSLVLSKYTSNPTVTVGFKLSEEVVTAADDIALYDNSGSTPNLTSPGADRYKITMTLIAKDDISAGETFYPVYEIKRGETRAVQTRDNLLSEVGGILSNRTNSITGDFIVRNQPFGEMRLNIEADSDTDYLEYKLEGGVAFVKGRRIERSSPETIRVQKSRNDPGDIVTKSNEFITASYGNYFLADSMYGLIEEIEDLATVNLYSAENRSGSLLGTARVRNIDEYDNLYRLHIFDVSLTSSNSLGAVRSIGNASNSYANLAAKDGRYGTFDKSNNSLLFPMPSDRVQEISSVTMAVRKIYTESTTSNGQVTFNTGSSNTFTNIEDWIVAIDSNGEVYSPPTFSGTPGTTATVTGLQTGTGSTVRALGYENISAVRKTKSLQTGYTETLNVSSDEFTTTKADIYKFTSVVDPTTSEDITYKFTFDNGQRDDYYMPGGGRLKNGQTIGGSTVTVTYDYFDHSAGDYFGGKPSYPDLEYENVPIYTTSMGQKYRLTDVIDMRPVKTDSNQFTGTGAVIENIPKNTDTITVGTAKYWQQRIDIVALDIDGSYTVYKGKSSSSNLEPENVPTDSLKLHKVTLNPYTVNASDLTSARYENRGYKMSDIQRLEKRIGNLETNVSLNMSEIQTLKQSISDPDDATAPERTKTGIAVDDFTTALQSHKMDPDYRAIVNYNSNTLMPMSFKRDIKLKYDSDLSTGVIQKGNTVWPKYTEEVMIDQSVASKGINVNQFEITRSYGAGFMEPNIDTWSTRKKVDEAYQPESTTSYVAQGSYSVSSQGN